MTWASDTAALGVHTVPAPVGAQTPPGPEAAWEVVELPHLARTATWYRVAFDASGQHKDQWAVYVPYLYGGGSLWLNGHPLAQVRQSGEGYRVRWERPFLFAIPDLLLKPGANELMVLTAPAIDTSVARMPLIAIGPHERLLADYERRQFWVRTMPQFTVVACTVVGLLVCLIWWFRREEMLYGLFGLAALLWGGRTLTFIIETLPADSWPLWRLFYHSATGGFIIVLTVFAMKLANMDRPWASRALLGYWLIGPLAYGLGAGEMLVRLVWAGGLIPIGIAMLVMCIVAAVRQRTWAMTALSIALFLAVLAGVSDYLLAADSPTLLALAPDWYGHRIFLLHYAADLLLLMMGAILSARFIAALQAVEQLNRTLESRVAEREKALEDNYAQLTRLERRHAADEERQRIMRDLHDGLGSQLFVALSRVEGRQIDHNGISESLRACIADMRLTLDAMSPDGNDFLDAWGSFRYRWEQQLDNAGVRSVWKVQTEDGVLELPAQAGLQVLRVAQEALTNVLKHASAGEVRVALRSTGSSVCLEVVDDGCGLDPAARPGRGLANMRSRALRLGGELLTEPHDPGTRLKLVFPRSAEPAGDNEKKGPPHADTLR